MSKESDIQQLRFIIQRIVLDEYETKGIKKIIINFRKALESGRIKLKTFDNLPDDLKAPMVLDQIKSIVDSLKGVVADESLELISKAGEFAYSDTAEILSWDGAILDYKKVEKTAGMIAGTINYKVLKEYPLMNIFGNIDDELEKAIQEGLQEGKGYKKILSELKKEYAGKFVGKKNKDGERNLETLIKTYIHGVSEQARKDNFEANEELIEKYEWSAVMENGNTKTGRGTCPRCMALDGQEYDDKDDAPPIPLHPRCRCMLLPKTKSWEDLKLESKITDDDVERFREKEWVSDSVAGRKWVIRDLKKRNVLLADWKPGTMGEREQVFDKAEFRKQSNKLKKGETYADFWLRMNARFQANAIGPIRSAWVKEPGKEETKKKRFKRIVVNSNKKMIALNKRRIDKSRPPYKLGDLIRIKDLIKGNKA